MTIQQFLAETVPQLLAAWLAVSGGFMLLRPLMAPGGYRHLLKVVDSVSSKVDESDDLAANEFHDLVLDLATAYAFTASGRFFPSKQAQKKPPHFEMILEFVEANSWCWPFITAVVLRLKLACFFARPWDIKLCLEAVIAWIILSQFQRADGGVDLAFARRSSRTQLEQLEQMSSVCPA